MADPLPLLGVSACLFRSGGVLLVERAHAPFEGRLSLPGGRVRLGETLLAAARREVREETGIDVPGLLFFHLHEAIDAASSLHAVIAVHRAGAEIEASARPLAASDARACAFYSLGALPALAAAERLTPGLAPIVEEAYRAHRRTI